MPAFQAGDIVRCVEAPDYLGRHISVGSKYVVNQVVTAHGANYLRILGDDDRGHVLLNSLFERWHMD